MFRTGFIKLAFSAIFVFLLSAAFAGNETLILLKAGTIDTAAVTAPESAGAKAFAASVSNESRLWLVQVSGPVTPEKYKELEASGAKIITYIPNNSYLVYGPPVALNKARMASNLQWNHEFKPEWKFVDSAAAEQDSATAKTGTARYWAVQMVADDEQNTATLALAGGVDKARRVWKVGPYCNAIVKVTESVARSLTARPDVVSVAPWDEPKLCSERQACIISGDITPTGVLAGRAGYLDWLAEKGFTQAQFDASNFAVDICDSGIENGTTSPYHFAMYKSGLTSGFSRVIYNYLVGTPNTGSSLAGTDGHGSINAHIVGGYSDLTTSYHQDSAGYKYGLGVCPFVKIGSTVVFDPDVWTYPDYTTMMSRAYQHSSRICNCSWGKTGSGAYDIDSQEFDYLVRDCCPTGAVYALAGNQPMVIAVAAGNDGPHSLTVGSPATAKNVIAVGATQCVQPFGGSNYGRDGCEVGDDRAANALRLASFSSRGPCTDNRIKPDICAPGTHIVGGAPQGSFSTTTGSVLAEFDAADVCGGPDGSNFFPTDTQWYTASSGTSHSTPAVAGACGLVRQWFINRGLGPASPAMTKAMLVTGTRFLSNEDTNLMSKNQGMGLVALDNIFTDQDMLIRDQADDDLLTATGQLRTFVRYVSDVTKPVYITLAYTDAPGNTVGAAYNNNLDLIVKTTQGTYIGNNYSGGWSKAGVAAADEKNNLESVRIPAGISGAVTITVKGTSINSNGVPGNGTVLDQDFALFGSNLREGTGINITVDDVTCISPSEGIPANSAEPYRPVTVDVTFTNNGATAVSDFAGVLRATSTIVPMSATFGPFDIPAGGSVTVPLTFAAIGEPGDEIMLYFDCTAMGESDIVLAISEIIGMLKEYSFTWSGTKQLIDGVTVSVPIDVNVDGKLFDVKFLVGSGNGCSPPGITHTYVSDLIGSLTNPDLDTTVTLFDSIGEYGDNICDMYLTDDAVIAVQSLKKDDAPFTGSFYPFDRLASFYGVPPKGTWYFNVRDAWLGDSGTINALRLDLTVYVDIPASGATTGSVRVDLTPAEAIADGAQWNIDGGAWNVSGLTIDNVSTGPHTIAFKDLTGWETPTPVIATVNADAVTTVVAAYTALPGMLTVSIVGCAEGAWQIAGETTWRGSGTSLSLPAGTYTVNYKDVDGYITPDPAVVTVSRGGAAGLAGIYVYDPLDIVLEGGDFTAGVSAPIVPGATVDFSWNATANKVVTDPFWCEIFSSKTGGFDLTRSGVTITNSYVQNGMGTEQTISPGGLTLNSVADGVYTLVPSLNRGSLPSCVPESCYTNNWMPIAGKRLSVHNTNPATVDLLLTEVTVDYDPSQPTKVTFNGKVKNIGDADLTKPGCWCEAFFGTLTSEATLMPQGTIGGGWQIQTLAAGAETTFTLPGTVLTGVLNKAFAIVVDSTDIVPEDNKVNNQRVLYEYAILPVPPDNGIDLAITDVTIDAAQLAPNTVKPGDALNFTVTVQNKGSIMPSGKVYLELFASRDGGASFVGGNTMTHSQLITPPALGETKTYSLSKPLKAIGDGEYTAVAVVNRNGVSANPGDITPLDNRFAYSGGRVSLFASLTGEAKNLVWSAGPEFAYNGNTVTVTGTVKNTGANTTQAFWTEAFIGTVQAKTGIFYRDTTLIFCAGKNCPGLASGETQDVSFTGTCPTGKLIGVLIDSLDNVDETDETDNYDYGEVMQ